MNLTGNCSGVNTVNSLKRSISMHFKGVQQEIPGSQCDASQSFVGSTFMLVNSWKMDEGKPGCNQDVGKLNSATLYIIDMFWSPHRQ